MKIWQSGTLVFTRQMKSNLSVIMLRGRITRRRDAKQITNAFLTYMKN